MVGCVKRAGGEVVMRCGAHRHPRATKPRGVNENFACELKTCCKSVSPSAVLPMHFHLQPPLPPPATGPDRPTARRHAATRARRSKGRRAKRRRLRSGSTERRDRPHATASHAPLRLCPRLACTAKRHCDRTSGPVPPHTPHQKHLPCAAAAMEASRRGASRRGPESGVVLVVRGASRARAPCVEGGEALRALPFRTLRSRFPLPVKTRASTDTCMPRHTGAPRAPRAASAPERSKQNRCSGRRP